MPWYQFTLRSLLLLTLFVAGLCSIGVCTHWFVSVVLGIGGALGRAISGTRSGLLLGIVSAVMCSIMVAFAGAFIWFSFFGWPLSWVPTPQFIMTMEAAAILGSLVGGVLGGFRARLGR